VAGVCRHDRGVECVSGDARAIVDRSELAVVGNHYAVADSNRNLSPARRFQSDADFDVCGEWDYHSGDDCLSRSADSRNTETFGNAASFAAVSGSTVGGEYSYFCAVVLETGCWGATKPGTPGRLVEKRVFVSANGKGMRRSFVDAALRGLSVSSVQHEHSIFADGYGGVIALGEAGDHAAVTDFVGDYCIAGGTRGEHPVSGLALKINPPWVCKTLLDAYILRTCGAACCAPT
jgi:hypothetical protein